MRDAIGELVAWRRGRMFYVRDSRAAPETQDMTDLIVVVPGLAALLELKSQRRATTPGQAEVAALLRTVTRFVGGIVRPQPKDGELGYDEVLAILGGGDRQ
jgi:hypothetical protein